MKAERPGTTFRLVQSNRMLIKITQHHWFFSYSCVRILLGSYLKKKFFKVEDVPLVEFMYLVFKCMPGESYRRQLWSLLLYLCYVFWALINSLVCKKQHTKTLLVSFMCECVRVRACVCVWNALQIVLMFKFAFLSKCYVLKWILNMRALKYV